MLSLFFLLCGCVTAYTPISSVSELNNDVTLSRKGFLGITLRLKEKFENNLGEVSIELVGINKSDRIRLVAKTAQLIPATQPPGYYALLFLLPEDSYRVEGITLRIPEQQVTERIQYRAKNVNEPLKPSVEGWKNLLLPVKHSNFIHLGSVTAMAFTFTDKNQKKWFGFLHDNKPDAELLSTVWAPFKPILKEKTAIGIKVEGGKLQLDFRSATHPVFSDVVTKHRYIFPQSQRLVGLTN